MAGLTQVFTRNQRLGSSVVILLLSEHIGRKQSNIYLAKYSKLCLLKGNLTDVLQHSSLSVQEPSMVDDITFHLHAKRKGLRRFYLSKSNQQQVVDNTKQLQIGNIVLQ
ncbi:uncharacterized protein A4U43_C03F23950 [Asparagus officinalis]|uniref:Uncharacterized protein n=1 Tax=Asparagus officinalis TaxID=4686 RepID=A0A5P1FDG8_ASPOF|nr:uncharacterized protein A4U43_C03F23950 [Asparagus officinalis]